MKLPQNSWLIRKARIVNEGTVADGDVHIRNGIIEKISFRDSITAPGVPVIEASGRFLLPGVIDDQVHFRDPGLTAKGDIHSESRAAVAGGVTSFMDMPNTSPKATTLEILEEKYAIAAEKSLANYSFFLGATNDNLEEIKKADPHMICGLKVFMGASTGNMLVDDPGALDAIFSQSPLLVAIHSEDETIIRRNLAACKEKYGENIPVEMHPVIRSAEACYESSRRAVELARKRGTRLHILHMSTGREIDLLDDNIPLEDKKITGEVCVHHLWFDDRDYAWLGSLIKWNPAIKSEKDKIALFNGLLSGKIDIIATDHAPHLAEEKKNPYASCPSGGPLIQHSLNIMLEFFLDGRISLETIVQKMAHNPAILYRIDRRGYIREGYHADLILVDPSSSWTVAPDNILYKCGWSPFEGYTFRSRVTHTFVNGMLVYENGIIHEDTRGERLLFT